MKKLLRPANKYTLQLLIEQHSPTQVEREREQQMLACFKERLSQEPSCAQKAERLGEGYWAIFSRTQGGI